MKITERKTPAIRNGAELLLRMAIEHFVDVVGAQRVNISFSVYDDKKSPCQYNIEVINPKKPGVLPKRRKFKTHQPIKPPKR
jgi:hypothetical protein